jgi:hypothetical protein
MEIGERWAYRARLEYPIEEVRVKAIGTKKPPRVKVAFLGDDSEGRVDWVSPARLKVPWSERAQYVERERRWALLRGAGSSMSASDDVASQDVFDLFLDRTVTERLTGPALRKSVTAVHDWQSLTRIANLEKQDLISPLDIHENGIDYLPWPAARTIAKAYARRNPTIVQASVKQQLEETLREVSSGRSSTGHRVFPELSAQFHEITRQQLATVNEWIGVEGVRQSDELESLRSAVHNAADLMTETIRELVDRGQTDLAWALHRWLFPDAEATNWTPVVKSERTLRRAAQSRSSDEPTQTSRNLIAQRASLVAELRSQDPPAWPY